MAPTAPGTVGTLAAVPLYFLLRELPVVYYALALLATFALGCWCCDRASKILQVHDHGGIVWDEFVGFWLTLLLAPPQWWWVIVAFLLFRLFDIVKPWPIGWVDKKVSGGVGIMLDDVLAGVYALVVLQVCAWFFIDYSLW